MTAVRFSWLAVLGVCGACGNVAPPPAEMPWLHGFRGIGLVLDVRSVVGPTTDATLVRVDASTYASMYSWEMSAAVGYQL